MLALIASGVLIAARRTDSSNIPVCKESVAGSAKQLFYSMFLNESVFFEVKEHLLCYLCLLLSRGPTEMVKCNSEPGIDVAMYCMIIIAQFPGRLAFFLRSGFGSCTILIGSANIESFIPPHAAESRKNISRQHLNKVAQVRYIINIG
jgi:hypothetical protein